MNNRNDSRHEASGSVAAPTDPTGFRIAGRVIDRTSGSGVGDLRIEAWDEAWTCDPRISSARTDPEGNFLLELQRSHLDGLLGERATELVFKIFRGDRLVSDSARWKVETASTSITLRVDVPEDERARPPTAHHMSDGEPPLVGRVIDAASGYPLVGALVRAYFVPPTSQEPRPAGSPTGDAGGRILLGEGRTGAGGRFDVEFRDDRLVDQLLFLLRGSGSACFVLQVHAEREAEPLHVSRPVRGVPVEPITVAVALPRREPRTGLWRELGERLQQARLTQLHRLMEHLVGSPADASLFGDWDLLTRHCLAGALETAFLDPRGVLTRYTGEPRFFALRSPAALADFRRRLAPHIADGEVGGAFIELIAKTSSFDDLLQVDWVVDVELIGDGHLAAGLGKHEAHYSPIVQAGLVPFPLVPLDQKLVNYRNYLRTIFTYAPTTSFYQERLPLLQKRFHQSFEGVDTGERPANQVLVPILRKILTAPKGEGYGFGLRSAAIPEQGGLSHREYLDVLIGLSGVSADELRLRYRLDLGRPDSALSSPVQEQIATLQGFYRDGFQAGPEPFPILPASTRGKAPFFLQYDEWLRLNGPFHGENHYPIRQTFTSGVGSGPVRAEARMKAQGKEDWLIAMMDIEELLPAAHEAFDQGQYAIARERYLEIDGLAGAALRTALPLKTVDGWLTPMQGRFAQLLALPVKNRGDLDAFTRFYSVHSFAAAKGNEPMPIHDKFAPWLDANRVRLQFGLVHFYLYVLPVCLGDVALAQGDYDEAVFQFGRTTAFLVGRARESSPEGYYGTWGYTYLVGSYARLYRQGHLPYTAQTVPEGYPFDSPDFETGGIANGFHQSSTYSKLASSVIPELTHPMERRFLCLRYGNALLEWADALYRTDQPGSVARARELYKAVLWLHGDPPPISPSWPTRFAIPPKYTHHQENPALVAQKRRAQQGLVQIDAGLNYHGLANDLVPALRYRPLKDAADRLAAQAKAAQQDFLHAMGRVEELMQEKLVLENMLQKADLHGRIAGEQKQIAEFDVRLAEKQVEQVEAAIAAKKKEIEDKEGLFTQFTDFVGGMKKAVTGLPDAISGLGASGAKSAAGTGSLTGAAAGGAAMAGYAVFVYAGVTSLTNLADAHDGLRRQLVVLRDEALPLARDQVAAKQRDVRISELRQQIAAADAELAHVLLHFQDTRFLNTDFWVALADVARRILRRFLELAARYAWLAERALAYEQDRSLRIVRFDYFPTKLQGVTGAQLLQADLAELEAARMEGIRLTVPVQHTYSLAFDFPLQFAQLRKTGRCTFWTRELPFQLAYPGTYGYRVRAIGMTVQTSPPGGRMLGLLSNQGMSVLSNADGSARPSLRFPDALPLSEFRLDRDMDVHGLPGEALLSFEGSGIETAWQLEFTPHANAHGLDNLADVLLTFDVHARYSDILRQKHLQSLSTSVRRFVFVSTRAHRPDALAELTGDASEVDVELDLPGMGLPSNETNRTIRNLVIFLASKHDLDFSAVLTPAAPATPVEVDFARGIALSNLPVLPGDPQPNEPRPLNALGGLPVDQVLTLTIEKGAHPDLDFGGVADIVIGIEYTADLG